MYDEASMSTGNNRLLLLHIKLSRADIMRRNDQQLEALELLQAMLPETKAYAATDPDLHFRAMLNLIALLGGFERDEECLDTAAEAVAFAEANYGMETGNTLESKEVYAQICRKVGRVEESKVYFADVLTANIRIFGRDHPRTLKTKHSMQVSGFFVL